MSCPQTPATTPNASQPSRLVKVGSRCSSLALTQTNRTISLLKTHHPHLQFEVVEIATIGDKLLNVSLSKTGEKGLFTKELEQAMLDKQVDFVVHSLKDVPTRLPDGLVLGCIFDRQSPSDVVVMAPQHRGKKLADLPVDSVIGTSAVRRVASLKSIYPGLAFECVRGNLNTRLAKLDGSFKPVDSSRPIVKYDALILAQAGIERLGWSDRIDEVLSDYLHAVGQGALACECRSNDLQSAALLASIHEHKVAVECIAERSLMFHLDGGCSTPIGVRTYSKQQQAVSPGDVVCDDCDKASSSLPKGEEPELEQVTLEASVFSVDGTECVSGKISADLVDCHSTDCLPPKLAKRDVDELGDDADHVTQSSFIGLKVANLTNTQLTALHKADQLGGDLARHLKASGASEILARIKTEAASTTIQS